MSLKGQGKEFMEKTRYSYLETSDQQKGLPQPPLELPAQTGKAVIELPSPDITPTVKIDVREAINRRASVRSFSENPITLSELSYILWSTQGVKNILDDTRTLRTVPSAGARHCFETYILVNRVESLKPGLYRYLAIEHKLQEVNLSENIPEKVIRACLNQRFILGSAATFIWTVDVYRMMWRYGERGYRYMHFDAGHVCQNLYLSAETIGCGVCAIAAFQDEDLNDVLSLDGVERFAIYVGVLGKKKTS
jgi:SagB-type dehydrogenase family enzyme